SSVTSNPAEPKCSRTSARTRTSSVTTSARRFAAVALDANRAAVMFILMGGSYRSSTSSLFHIEHHPFTLGSALGDRAPRSDRKALRAVPGDIRRGHRSCRKREGEHVAVRVEHAESEQATRVAVQPRGRSRSTRTPVGLRELSGIAVISRARYAHSTGHLLHLDSCWAGPFAVTVFRHGMQATTQDPQTPDSDRGFDSYSCLAELENHHLSIANRRNRITVY